MLERKEKKKKEQHKPRRKKERERESVCDAGFGDFRLKGQGSWAGRGRGSIVAALHCIGVRRKKRLAGKAWHGGLGDAHAGAGCSNRKLPIAAEGRHLLQ